MAWLNLNVEFGYGYNSYTDWEEMPFQDEMTNQEIEFHETYGYVKSSIFKSLPCDDYPFRSGMKNDRHWWGYRGSERTKHGLNTWAFMEYVIEKNIGKSFSQAFSYYCKFVNRQYQKYFLERFENYNSIGRGYNERYWIDDNDIIHDGSERLGRWYWRNNGPRNIFTSFDYKEVWLMKLTKNVYERNWKKMESEWKVRTKYEDKIVYKRSIEEIYLRPEGWTYYDGENHKAVELKSVTGYKEENINRRSDRFKKLRAEDDARYRKQQREEERLKKQIVYSFLTREEKELKEARKLDQYNLYRHGFDDESFKGEPYHGRKKNKFRDCKVS